MALTPAQVQNIIAASRKDVPQSKIAAFTGIAEEQVRAIVYAAATGSTPDAIASYLNSTSAPAAAPAPEGLLTAAHPGQIFDQASDGVKTPPVDPFLTGEDIQNEAAARANYENTVNNAQGNYEQAVINTNYGKGEIDRNAPKQVAAADDSAIGRGIFHSSIRDADLADIEATNRIRRDFLDKNLEQGRINLGNVRRGANDAWTGFQLGQNQRAVDNARNVNDNQAPYLPGQEPRAAGWRPPTPQETNYINAGISSKANPSLAPKPPAPPLVKGPPVQQKTTNGPDLYRGNTGKRRK